MSAPIAGSGTPMPVVFVGHGSPMNAIENNTWSRAFAALGAQLTAPQLPAAPASVTPASVPQPSAAHASAPQPSTPRVHLPRAVLAISAHWYVPGTFTTANPAPPTIHDFGGFPPPLYEVQYPAPGDPALARRVAALLAAFQAEPRMDWGLDHGTWSVLLHMWPAAQVPVVQLSIDQRQPPAVHLAIGRALAPLRHEGVLILASGNVTHNLRHAFRALQTGDNTTPDWATQFDAGVARALEQHDAGFLSAALGSREGRLSHPTPDHYLPLLYAAGAAFESAAAVEFPITGFDLASLSMRAAVFR